MNNWYSNAYDFLTLEVPNRASVYRVSSEENTDLNPNTYRSWVKKEQQGYQIFCLINHSPGEIKPIKKWLKNNNSYMHKNDQEFENYEAFLTYYDYCREIYVLQSKVENFLDFMKTFQPKCYPVVVQKNQDLAKHFCKQHKSTGRLFVCVNDLLPIGFLFSNPNDALLAKLQFS